MCAHTSDAHLHHTHVVMLVFSLSLLSLLLNVNTHGIQVYKICISCGLKYFLKMGYRFTKISFLLEYKRTHNGVKNK